MGGRFWNFYYFIKEGKGKWSFVYFVWGWEVDFRLLEFNERSRVGKIRYRRLEDFFISIFGGLNYVWS